MNRIRLALVICGLGLALAGVTLDDPRMVWGSIAVLLVSLILRLIIGKRANRNSKSDG